MDTLNFTVLLGLSTSSFNLPLKYNIKGKSDPMVLSH